MGKIVNAVIGGAKAAKASQAPVQQTEDEKKKAKTSRQALIETSGGVAGQELLSGQTQQRSTLLGN